MLEQMPLPIRFHAVHSFDEYHTGPNREAVESLRACASGDGETLIFLWGGRGLGKSHLLQACVRHAASCDTRALYLPLTQLKTDAPDVLDQLESLPLLCIDDVETLAGDELWEHTLFNLFNRARAAGQRLVISACGPPQRTGIQLPDLCTRLGWGLTLQLQPLDDNDKLEALMLRARTLGFELAPQVGRYLLRHHPRGMPELWALIDELDRATLSAKRKLTIPFLKTCLDNRR